MDEVCATGTDENDNPVGPTCDTVTVTRSDVTPTARAEKRAIAFCIDVTYQVKVFNTSALDPLTLNALNDDKFGDITTADGPTCTGPCVVSTTCINDGIIPFSGTNSYTCDFVGRFCGTSATGAGTTPHTNTVGGELTDDENNMITTAPDGSATVTITTSTTAP